MSDLSDSGISGVSGWALVNSKGELAESSDVDSYTSSTAEFRHWHEVKEHVPEVNETQNGYEECNELEQLMKQADAAECAARQNSEHELREEPASISTSSDTAEEHVALITDFQEPGERRRPAEEDDRVLPHSPDCGGLHSASSSASLLSVSDLSSLLSTTSKSNTSDTDSDSDFVRLEKESSNISTESEGEEPLPRLGAVSMTTSGSSVSSGFNFLTTATASAATPVSSSASLLPYLQHLDEYVQTSPQPQPPAQQPQILQPVEVPLLQPPTPPPPQQLENEDPPYPHALHAEEEADEHVAENLLPPPALADGDMSVDEEADTESSAEDQDDRIESEQSDDANSAQADNIDLSILNDLGDIPVERGAAERHYVHCNNPQLNGRLNRMMLAVLVLALGMGLGHWIGSTREHISQMEIQLTQMKRMHQIQDEYVQCLSHNDKLLLSQDIQLQSERERHSEAMADLHYNNDQLQKQLQDAQEQLEHLMSDMKRQEKSFHGAPPSCHGFTDSSQNSAVPQLDLISLVLAINERNLRREIRAREESLDILRREINAVINENDGLRMTINKLDYNPDAYAEYKVRQVEWLPCTWDKVTSVVCVNNSCDPRLELIKLVHADIKELVAMITGWEAESFHPPKDADWSNEQEELPGRSHKVLETLSHKKREELVSHAKLASEQYDHLLFENRELRRSLAKILSKRSGDPTDDSTLSMPPPPNPVPPPPLVLKFPNEEHKEKDFMSEENDSGVTVEVEDDNFEDKVPDTVTELGAMDHEDVDLQNDGIVFKKPTQKTNVSNKDPKPVPMDALMLLQRNLTQERERSEMWRNLYMSQCTKQQQTVNTTTCLNHLRKELNMTTFLQYITEWNLTGQGLDKFADLSTLLAGVVNLKQNLVQALPSLWDELTSTIYSLKSGGSGTGTENGKISRDKNIPEEDQASHRKGRGGEEHEGETRWAEGVKKLLNKTRSTLSNVSQQLQQTWNQVKNSSRLLWPTEDSLLGRMAARVTETFSRVSHKMHKKTARWFQKLEKKMNKKHKWEKEKKKNKPSKFKKAASQERGDLRQSKETKKDSHLDKKHIENVRKPFETEKKKQNLFEGTQKQKDKKQKHHERRNNDDKDRKKTHNENDTTKTADKDKIHLKKENNKLQYKQDRRKESHKSFRDDPVEEAPVSPLPDAGAALKQDGGRTQGERGKDKLYNSELKEDVKRPKNTKNKGSKEDGESNSHSVRKDEHLDQQGRHRDTKKKINEHKVGNSWSDMKMGQEPRNHDQEKNHNPERLEREQERRVKLERAKPSEDGSTYAETRISRARVKLEQAFNRLFINVGAMSKDSFQTLDQADIEVIYKRIVEISDNYGDGSKLDLPVSGHHWLSCQAAFWKAVNPQHCCVHTSATCRHYLAPWQQTLTKTITPARNEKNVDLGEEDGSPDGKVRGKKCKRENDREEGQRSDNSNTTWYTHWLQGRDSLRSGGCKADWLFNRAQEREAIRQQESAANWVFERAKDRDASREDRESAEENKSTRSEQENEKESQENDKVWNHLWHRSETGKNHHQRHNHFERSNPKEFRQKYGSKYDC